MTPSQITLDAVTIFSNAHALNIVNGPHTEVHGTGGTTITGRVVKIN
jgi:type VI secretion system secreted protein VgrG